MKIKRSKIKKSFKTRYNKLDDKIKMESFHTLLLLGSLATNVPKGLGPMRTLRGTKNGVVISGEFFTLDEILFQ